MSTINGRYVKYTSQESAPYTEKNNRVNYNIPAGDYDLSKSYVAIYSQMDVTDNVNVNNAVYDVKPRWKTLIGTDYPEIPNVALIRNCNLYSSILGRCENIRRCDILRTNLRKYTKTTGQLETEKHSMFSPSADEYEKDMNMFINKNTVGSEPSSYKEVPILIKLSEMFELGKIKWSEKLGNIKLNLELNLDKVLVDTNVSGFPPDVLDDITLFDPYDNTSGSDEDINYMKSLFTFSDDTYEQIPYYVGEPLLITYNIGSGNVETYAVIDNIQRQDDDSILLVFRDNLVTVPSGAALSIVKVEKVKPSAANLLFNRCELVLFQSDIPYPAPEGPYLTWTTEEVQITNTNNLQRQFDIEPNALNLLAMNVEGDLYADAHNIDSFRLRVNGTDLNDRDVILGNHNEVDVYVKHPNGIYYQNISDTFNNMGLQLANLNERIHFTNKLRESRQESNQHSKMTLIACPMVVTQNQKLVQLNLEGANINHVLLFKNVVRSF